MITVRDHGIPIDAVQRTQWNTMISSAWINGKSKGISMEGMINTKNSMDYHECSMIKTMYQWKNDSSKETNGVALVQHGINVF